MSSEVAKVEVLTAAGIGSLRIPREVAIACLCALILVLLPAVPGAAQQTSTPQSPLQSQPPAQSKTGIIAGTVIDVNGGPVPSAEVTLEGPEPADRRQVEANANGFFELGDLRPGVPWRVTIRAKGFVEWSSVLTLTPGQYLELTGARLKVASAVTTVHAAASTEQIATEQVDVALNQRVFGFIPNFFVTYDNNPVPLTPKLKFKLSLRAATDPVTFAGAATIAGLNQAGGKYDWPQNTTGYFQRFGASYTNTFTDIIIGGGLLASLLHQDPRYFYQGTGTTKSRVLHAISNPFIARGDNGRRQINYSNLGGVLISGAIANAYFPDSNRGFGLVLNAAAVDLGAGVVNSLLQEFVLRGLTHSR